jgi:hypothetical protein
MASLADTSPIVVLAIFSVLRGIIFPLADKAKIAPPDMKNSRAKRGRRR